MARAVAVRTVRCTAVAVRTARYTAVAVRGTSTGAAPVRAQEGQDAERPCRAARYAGRNRRLAPAGEVSPPVFRHHAQSGICIGVKTRRVLPPDGSRQAAMRTGRLRMACRKLEYA